MVGITTERLSLISPGEVKDIGWEVVPMWQQATDGADDKKYLGFTLGVECFDTKEYRHETTYHIMMSNDRTSLVFGAEELGEGIYGYRTSKSKPFWPTRWKGKIRTAVEKGQQFWRKSGKKP